MSRFFAALVSLALVAVTVLSVRVDAAPATAAVPLFCPLPPESQPHTLLLSPCLMALNQLLAEAALSGSKDLVASVPEAAQFFDSSAPHLDATKWRATLRHLTGTVRHRVEETNIYTVMAKNVSAPRTDGDKHHYYSLAPYWWPNASSPDGLPYILRDGDVNPESREIGDQQAFTKLADDVYTLSLGYYLLGSEAAASRAVDLLRAWYVTPATRMLPSLDHAQVRRGHDDDRGQPTGIIELVKHVQIVDALALLQQSPIFVSSADVRTGLDTWFTEYLFWLRNSTLGIAAHAAENNHHTYFNLQAAVVAGHVDQWSTLVAYLAEVWHRLVPSQINRAGAQPFELARADSWHYSAFNLEALCELAAIAQHLCDARRVPDGAGTIPDLFAYNADVSDYDYNGDESPYATSTVDSTNTTTPGRSILAALDYLMPYLPSGGLNWTASHRQDVSPNFAQVGSPIRLLLATVGNAGYTRPTWAKRQMTFAYADDADAVDPLTVSTIDWLLIGPDLAVASAPSSGSSGWPSFSLLITLFRSYFPFFLPIGLLGVYRWSSFFLRAGAAAIFYARSAWTGHRPPPHARCYRPESDVTVVVPTIDHGPELKEALATWILNRPAAIILVTADYVRPALERTVDEVVAETRAKLKHAAEEEASSTKADRAKPGSRRNSSSLKQPLAPGCPAFEQSFFPAIRILSIPRPNKRQQMVVGLSAVVTQLVVFADDDAIWQRTCLNDIAAAFDDPSIGGVGTEQRMRPVDEEKGPTFWEILADFRLTAKSIENAAACQLGGAVTCLSGRTAAYRTCVFRPRSDAGPICPRANACFGGTPDDATFKQEHFLPVGMMRRRQRELERKANLPPDALTRREIRALMHRHEYDGMPSVVSPFEVHSPQSAVWTHTWPDSPGGFGAVAPEASHSPAMTPVKPHTIAITDAHSGVEQKPKVGLRDRFESHDDSSPSQVSEEACDQLYYEFCYAFLNDFFHVWCRSPAAHLHSGDDKTLTRWIAARGWRMLVLVGPRSCIRTTFKPNWHFLKQYMRWTRNTWRSDFRSLFVERTVWRSRSYWFLIFLMLDKMLSPFTLLIGPCFIAYLCTHASLGWHATPHDRDRSYRLPVWNILVSYACWLLISRVIRLAPHFVSRPRHLLYVPCFVVAQYVLAPLKLYCLFTLHDTEWGTRSMRGDELVLDDETIKCGDGGSSDEESGDEGAVGAGTTSPPLYQPVPNEHHVRAHEGMVVST